jgi:hypothetical protein
MAHDGDLRNPGLVLAIDYPEYSCDLQMYFTTIFRARPAVMRMLPGGAVPGAHTFNIHTIYQIISKVRF